LETTAEKLPLQILMATSGKVAARVSGRTTSTANNTKDIFARAEEASRQLSEQVTLTKDRKTEIGSIIDELIKKAKTTPDCNRDQDNNCNQEDNCNPSRNA
jgi:hypothetical protein